MPKPAADKRIRTRDMNGIVGQTAVIEDNVSMLQDVTLGGTGKERGDRHPKIRRGVLIGSGSIGKSLSEPSRVVCAHSASRVSSFCSGPVKSSFCC